MWKVSGAMKRLSFSIVSLGVAAALTAVLAPGCTTHGEGGRCDPNNTNTTGGFADCDATNSNGEALVCTSGQYLALPEGGTVEGFVCCPSNRAKATTDICKGSPISPGSDASISDATPDQSTADVTTSDVTNDVAIDAPVDAQGDASSSDASDAD
jgi:hypothetical protein